MYYSSLSFSRPLTCEPFYDEYSCNICWYFSVFCELCLFSTSSCVVKQRTWYGSNFVYETSNNCFIRSCKKKRVVHFIFGISFGLLSICQWTLRTQYTRALVHCVCNNIFCKESFTSSLFLKLCYIFHLHFCQCIFHGKIPSFPWNLITL